MSIKDKLSRKEKRLWRELSSPSYHKNSELRHQAGYYPNLSASQKECILQVKSKLKAANISLKVPREYDNLYILRFLRAKDFDINGTFSLLQQHILWQRKMDYDNLIQETCRNILQCRAELFFDIFPWYFSGTDKQDRPILWGNCGKFELWRLTQLTSLESIVRLFIWGCAQIERRLSEQCQLTGYNIENVVVILNVADWNLGLATKDAFSFVHDLVEIGSLHYPERLGIMLVVNAPPSFTLAWKAVMGFLSPSTQEKVKIIPCESNSFHYLTKHVDVSQIPKEYGGTSHDLNVEMAIESLTSLQSMHGYEEHFRHELCEHSLNPDTNNSESTGPRLQTLEKVKEELEIKLSLRDAPSLDCGMDSDKKQDEEIDMIRFSPTSANLKIYNSKCRNKRKKRMKKNSATHRQGIMNKLGHWMSSFWMSSAAAQEAKHGGHEKRRRDSFDSNDCDIESDSAASQSSFSSGESSGTCSTTTVYDEVGGNVLHCSIEDMPVKPTLPDSPLDSDGHVMRNWSHMEYTWKFDASTQTDISSFDSRFVFKERSDCSGWSDLFTCVRSDATGLI